MPKKTIALLAAGLMMLPFLASAQTTSDQINQILQQIRDLQAQLATLQSQQTAPAWCYTFNTDLQYGDGGASGRVSSVVVQNLQTALQKEGFQIDNAEQKGGSVFQDSTAAAVVAFQQKYGIRATGYVGPLTRAKLNSLYGCGNQPGSPVSTPTQPSYPVYTPTYPTSPAPTINVISPSAGANLQLGQPYTITWTESPQLNVTYTLRDYATQQVVATLTSNQAGCASGACSFSWTPAQATSNDYIYVSDYTNSAHGHSGMFSVVNQGANQSLAPSISSVSPAVGTSGALVTVNGTNFISGSSINFSQNGSLVASISSLSINIVSPNQITFAISGALAANISSGTYQLSVVNSNGNSNSVNFSLSAISPALSVSPASLSFSMTQGGSNPTSQQITLSNCPTIGCGYQNNAYTSAGYWLTVSGPYGTGSTETLTVQTNAGSLSPGTYNGSIAVMAGSQTVTVPVALTVAAVVQAPSLYLLGYGPSGQGATTLNVRTGDPITVSGIPQNLATGFSRAWFFGSILNGACSNNGTDSSIWNLNCTVNATGTAQVYVEIYQNGQTYRSTAVTVNVSQPTPTITVTSPVSGATLTAGNTYQIQWTAQGVSTSAVNISLGHMASDIVTNLTLATVPTGSGSWTWTVPATATGNYWITVQATDYSVYGQSKFSIAAPTPNFTVRTSAQTPLAGYVQAGAVNIPLFQFEIWNNSSEDVKITGVAVLESVSPLTAPAQFSNLALWDVSANSKVADAILSPGTTAGTYNATFYLPTPSTVPANSYRSYYLRSDVIAYQVKPSIVGTSGVFAVLAGGVTAFGASSNITAVQSGSAAGNSMTVQYTAASAADQSAALASILDNLQKLLDLLRAH